jgi:hypothetical protein
MRRIVIQHPETRFRRNASADESLELLYDGRWWTRLCGKYSVVNCFVGQGHHLREVWRQIRTKAACKPCLVRRSRSTSRLCRWNSTPSCASREANRSSHGLSNPKARARLRRPDRYSGDRRATSESRFWWLHLRSESNRCLFAGRSPHISRTGERPEAARAWE